MNVDEAQEVFSNIVLAWPTPHMSDLVASVWFETLADVNYDAAMTALREFIAEYQFRPTPGDFARIASGTQSPIERGYNEYLASMSGTATGPLSPPVQTIVDELGGWAYCHAQPIEFHDRFRRAWKARYHLTNPFNLAAVEELRPAEHAALPPASHQ